MKVKFVNWGLQYSKLKSRIDKAVLGCFERGDFIMRSEVEKFEKNLAEFLGVKYAIGLNSGTDALYLSLWTAGIKPGDEVITVSHTFVATFAVIKQLGAIPVLIDVKAENYLMDIDKIEEAITEKTKAIIPVHLNGRMCDMEKIMEIANRRNLIVIEDACQAFSIKQNEKMAGSFGLTGCFSFYPSKLIGACGDAGAVATNSDEIAEKIRMLRDHGRKTKTETICFGVNSRLDNIQAAVINVKMKYYLKKAVARRMKVNALYNEGLKNIVGLKLVGDDYCENYVIRAERRDELSAYLTKNKIETQIHEPMPYHLALANQLDRVFTLPITEQLSREIITLPLNPEITNEQVQYIIRKIKKFYKIKKG